MDLNAEIQAPPASVKDEDLFLNDITSAPSQPRFLPENALSANLHFFPAPNPDPFRDDPFTQPDQLLHVPLDSSSFKPLSQKIGSTTSPVGASNGVNGDVDYLGEQFDQISNRTGKQETQANQWFLESNQTLLATRTTNGLPESEQNGLVARSTPHICLESPAKDSPVPNGLWLDSDSSTQLMSHDSITISPPPQSTKPGRGRRTVKVNL